LKGLADLEVNTVTADILLRIGADTCLRNPADTSSACPLTSGVRMTPVSSYTGASRSTDGALASLVYIMDIMGV